VLKKFRNQIKPLAVSRQLLVALGQRNLQGLAVDKDLEDWLTTTLLPVVIGISICTIPKTVGQENSIASLGRACHTLQAHRSLPHCWT